MTALTAAKGKEDKHYNELRIVVRMSKKGKWSVSYFQLTEKTGGKTQKHDSSVPLPSILSNKLGNHNMLFLSRQSP